MSSIVLRKNMADYKKLNNKLFQGLSIYLNFNSDGIKPEMVEELMITSGLSEIEAVKILLSSLMGMDIDENIEDRQIYFEYFPKMVKKLDPNIYLADAYYQNIHFSELRSENIEFKEEKYMPFELFVYDDIEMEEDGKQIPKLGYFDREFVYPTILENGQNWMSVTPNEVETMKKDILDAKGRVLTFGLGLGYFAYKVALKPEVESVTIVEINDAEIDLFNKYILPQFSCKDKIKVIKADAYKFAKENYPKRQYDYVYVDIWHDVGDGMEMYKKMKSYEQLNPSAEYRYWIEKSIKCYM